MALFMFIVFVISLIGALYCSWYAKKAPTYSQEYLANSFNCDHNSRIYEFINSYLSNRSSFQNSDPHKMFSAKITTLESKEEIISACNIFLLKRTRKINH